MALDTYSGLQTAILSWLARPGDTLVEPAVPDMIRLFEREATRRLKVAGAEKRASLTALSSAVLLPADFGELTPRHIRRGQFDLCAAAPASRRRRFAGPLHDHRQRASPRPRA